MNILVLCTGNSARSILLESILTHKSDGRITGFSAGSTPSAKVHPQSLILLAEKGYPTDGLRSKSWDEFGTDDAPQMDIVITVCGSAAAEECPYWPGAPIRVHWGVEDPAVAAEPDWDAAFNTAYDQLHTRAMAFLALDTDGMDQATLTKELTRIGTL
ncbi:MAG: arsenate reductase ArsC [Yoonia sp.]